MSRKPTSHPADARAAATTLAVADLEQAIARDGTRLPALEEKALRMRHGLPATRTLVLERVGQDHPEARERLLDIELELLRQWRARQEAAAPAAPARAAAEPALPDNPRRAEIVAALRQKKPAR